MENREEERLTNLGLLWDLHRNIRYASKRMGWYDFVYRLSLFLSALCGSAAFAAFAGQWQLFGLIVSGISAFLGMVCTVFSYRPTARLYRDARRRYRELLAACEQAGGEEMSSADRSRLRGEYCRAEAEAEEDAPATLPLLMAFCENETAAADFSEPWPKPYVIPGCAVLIRQVWHWTWPAKPAEK